MVKVNKLFLVLLCTVTFQFLKAQIVVIPQEPIMKCHLDDLWSVQLIGKEPNMNFYKVRVKISEKSQGLVLDMVSSAFQMENGGRMFNAKTLNEIGPISTNYANPIFMDQLNRNRGVLGLGSYSIQYSVIATAGDVFTGAYQEVAFDNINHEVILAQPTDLLFLDNYDTIQHKFPSFSWTPTLFPAAALDGSIIPEIHYVFNLAQLLPNQSSYQAITSNPYVYSEAKLKQTYLQYPIIAVELEDSTTYVWQVHAYLDNKLISSSEIWQFTIWTKKREVIVPTPLVRKERTQNFIQIKENQLGFSYLEEHAGGKKALKVAIYNERTQSYLPLSIDHLETKNGMNQFQLSLCPDGLNLKDGLYMLEVADVNGQAYFLRFIYSQTDGCY